MSAEYTKAKRNRLAKRREPYWHKLILGGYIGYRVGAIGGSWIARYRDEAGKQRYKSLDLPVHLAVNEFDCAAGEANKWFDSQQQGFRAMRLRQRTRSAGRSGRRCGLDQKPAVIDRSACGGRRGA